ncbi:amidophosphoribosyltransferase, partial [bacterium]|nr:amidophosphoribosyltransferase [bacterium]
MSFNRDKPGEYCGVIGVHGHPEAAGMVYLGLYSLQHRGQEASGIVSTDGKKFYTHSGQGLVNDVFSSSGIIEKLKGHMAIGHNRYSTTGTASDFNVQPILVNSNDGPLALGHNGNLVNSRMLRDLLQGEGALFQTSTDSEVIVHLIARSKEGDLIARVKDALQQVRGAYSLVILTRNMLIGARDPSGFRPLSLGSVQKGHIIASETCAMDLIGADYIRDIKPDELLVIDEKGVRPESIDIG